MIYFVVVFCEHWRQSDFGAAGILGLIERHAVCMDDVREKKQ